MKGADGINMCVLERKGQWLGKIGDWVWCWHSFKSELSKLPWKSALNGNTYQCKCHGSTLTSFHQFCFIVSSAQEWNLETPERWVGRFHVLISFPNVIGTWTMKRSASERNVNRAIHPPSHLVGQRATVMHVHCSSNGDIVELVQPFWRAIWQYGSKNFNL